MYKIIFVALFSVLIGCNQKQGEMVVSSPIVVSGTQPGNGPYFTKDHLGNPVLCWTAGEKNQEQLYYAVYNNEAENFNEAIAVPSIGISCSPETMNKVVFKNDGTVIAVFARKHPTDQNKFAGALLYTQSFDGGKSWTTEKFLHSDSLPGNSRSYFDLALLPDGEVGAVWLDGRLKKGKDGSALFFAKTKGNEGFLSDKPIAETVCQCCRTDIYVDAKEKVHVLYRDIDNSIKGQVRDFAHIVSSDNGDTFSTSNKISDDNWVVDGCPHTGASITSNQEKIEIVWFTAGGTPGLYYTRSTNNDSIFEPRQLITENGRHPQMTSLGTWSVIAYQESTTIQEQTHADHGAHGNKVNHDNVVLMLKEDGVSINKVTIENEGEYPVLCSLNTEELLIAYTKEQKVIVKKVKI